MSGRKTKEKRQEELSKKLADNLNLSLNAHTEDMSHSAKRINDYIVTVAVENSYGLYAHQTDGSLDWETPESFGTQHVEIIIQDRDDKRFVPYLDVKVKIFDKGNNLITESEAPFMWHPYAYHYGFDTTLPADGEYYFEVKVKKPKFDRHHLAHGKKYQEDIATMLGPVEIVLPGEEINLED
jgi:hypothetical protein